MLPYQSPLRDYRFVLYELLNGADLAALPGYQEATPDLFMSVLEEGAKFCEAELLPLNQSGDAEGCHYENGVVRTPAGFKAAYDTYIAGGWPGLTGDPAFGGQGFPKTANLALSEIMSATNLSFGIYPGLSGGAAHALTLFGTEEQKRLYLPRLNDGTWSGTMCLTEPQCGTDLGLIRTKAEPNDDGSYNITGTKIFISAGEHDLSNNIVHLVLARLPDAPSGTRGISLFVVPKFLPRPDGQAGARNGVSCGGIEHKMGIKASATCTMNFDRAVGWLVGEPHRGMRAMFAMMNAARLGVAMQGLGIADAAYQASRHYALERLQGRALNGVQSPEKPADPLVVHPDIRRMLLTQKSLSEGARALGMWIALEYDRAERHPDPQQRQDAEDFVALMTPIAKSLFTDIGFDCANLGIQIMGGHGYIQDNGMEQFVRDARITQLYEGANGIQALDLIGRKMPVGTGRLLRQFFHPVAEFLESAQMDPAMMDFTLPLAKAFAKLQQTTAWLAQAGLKDANDAAAGATDFLKLFGLVAMGYLWARTAQVSLTPGPGDRTFYDVKLATARFYMTRILPQHVSLALTVTSGAKPLMDLPASQI